MNSKNKKILLFQRLLIWVTYLSSGYVLYLREEYLFSFLIYFTKVIYPLSIFWLQIRIKRRDKFLPIDSTMSTSQLWYSILPVFASIITIVLALLNLFLYIADKLTIY